jgi:hypothetical protein
VHQRTGDGGDPVALSEFADRRAGFFATMAGVCFGLALAVNYLLAFVIWRLIG